jgi:DNA/RNA-binding domain of Phe-tRNA-synthetase-like protein
MAGPPFRVESAFSALFPHCVIGTIVVRGLDNGRHGAECAALLEHEARRAAECLGEADIATHPAIAPWREAYRSFGVKPAKFRSSIENLLRSARAGTIRSINPLVDLYNAVSLRYMLPCGGEDLDAVRGPIVLTRAVGDEHFIPLGSTEEQPPQPGEVIYRDEVGVICRCWNWREADRTKLTALTTDAFLCIEGIPPAGTLEVRQACDALAALVVEHLGGVAKVRLLPDDGSR